MLALGDVVGEAATLFLRRTLPRFRGEKGIDLVLANGENSAVGNGVLPFSADHLFASGVDAITTDEMRTILESEGKIYTQIKIDEISNPGAVKIRLRSLFAATGR